MSRPTHASKWHDFGDGPPVEGVPIACLTCGAEVIWTKDDENRVTSLYRRPGEIWSKEHPPCHEQTGLFG